MRHVIRLHVPVCAFCPSLEPFHVVSNLLCGRACSVCPLLHYCKQTPEDVRRQLLSSWVDHLNLELFDFKRFIASESEQLQWKVEGLPADQLSMENACVLLQVSSMPACMRVLVCTDR